MHCYTILPAPDLFSVLCNAPDLSVSENHIARVHHEYIYVDKIGCDLNKTRWRGRNIIGQRAIVNGQDR